MRMQPVNFRPTDKYVKQVLDETYYGQQKQKPVVLKLPCECVSIQILEPKTIRPVCPKCGKKYILSWSMMGQKIAEVA